jgi:hypothetical protein
MIKSNHEKKAKALRHCPLPLFAILECLFRE